MKTHCMLDLETLGTSPGSVILSIGAVTFTDQGLGERFYANVSIQSCLNRGLTVDGGAIKFWFLIASQQNREDLFDKVIPLPEALSKFTHFFQNQNCAWLWSHGSNFDIPVLAAAYKATGHGEYVPWTFRLTRDTRTLFSFLTDIQRKRFNVIGEEGKHNALGDAVRQARWVTAAYDLLGRKLET